MKSAKTLSLSLIPSSSISISVSKPKNQLFDEKNSTSPELLFSEKSSPKNLKLSLSDCKESSRLDTIREFEDVDENAPSIREENSLMCMNCYETLNLESIDPHSLVCTTPLHCSKNVYEKLNKLLGFIREKKYDAEKKQLYSLIQLEDIGKNIIQGTFVIFIQKIPQVFNRLNFILKFSDFAFMSVISQRMIKLVEALPDGICSEKTENKNKMVLEIIESTLHGSEDHKESFLSIYSDIGLDLEIPNCYDCAAKDKTMEKCFYNQCIKKKLELPPNHNSRNLSIFQLYQECVHKNVPMAEWTNFINSAFVEQINTIT